MAGVIAKLLKPLGTIQPLMIGTFPTWMAAVPSKGKTGSCDESEPFKSIWQQWAKFTKPSQGNVPAHHLAHYLVKQYISLSKVRKEELHKLHESFMVEKLHQSITCQVSLKLWKL